jgi:hypothetical protein
MGNRKTWGVLGKRQTFLSPSDLVKNMPKVPLNANPIDSWDVKKSRYRRVDGTYPEFQQGGVVPQETASAPVVSPTQTPSNTASPTPSFTPTPSSTPYPLPLNPTIWYDASDSSTLTLINSGGTNYVSAWQSKGTTIWSLSGSSTDTMPVLSASTLMPGNPNIVRFTPNATTSLRDYMVSFNNTPIGHTGSTIFQVFAKPSGSTYATALFNTRVYSGLTNGGIATINSGAALDAQNINMAANGSLSSIQTYASGTTASSSIFTIPVYSATNLNDKFIFQTRTPLTAGQFATFELNQSGGTNTSAFTGTTVIPFINSFSLSVGNITTGGTITATNSSMELCEVMYFDTVLTDSQVEQVELYLKDKWRYDEWASPVPTPTPTASTTATPTPSLTPTNTNTPTITNTPSPTPPFNPLTLNPMIWVDFNDTSTISLRSGQYITSISNKGNWTALTSFSQGTASDQPSWSASTMGSGMSAVTIGDEFLNSNLALTGSAWNTFMVLKYSGTNPFNPIAAAGNIGGSAAAWGNVYPQAQLSRYANYQVVGGFEYRAAFTPYTAFTTPHVVQGYFSNSATTIVDYLSVNNSAQTKTIVSNSVANTGLPGSIGSATFRIINAQSGFGAIPGEIGEIMMFDKELTSTQQTNLINYLKTKWGIL